MSIRRIREQARRALHNHMCVPAYRFVNGPTGGHTAVRVRLHRTRGLAGDVQGTSLSYARVSEEDPRLIFMRDEFIPVRGEVFVLAENEAYSIEYLDPSDGLTISAQVVRLTASDAALYVFPDPAEIVSPPTPPTDPDQDTFVLTTED